MPIYFLLYSGPVRRAFVMNQTEATLDEVKTHIEKLATEKTLNFGKTVITAERLNLFSITDANDKEPKSLEDQSNKPFRSNTDSSPHYLKLTLKELPRTKDSKKSAPKKVKYAGAPSEEISSAAAASSSGVITFKPPKDDTSVVVLIVKGGKIVQKIQMVETVSVKEYKDVVGTALRSYLKVPADSEASSAAAAAEEEEDESEEESSEEEEAVVDSEDLDESDVKPLAEIVKKGGKK
jgi:hypothetical protein